MKKNGLVRCVSDGGGEGTQGDSSTRTISEMSEVCLEGTPSDCMSQRGHLVTIDIIYALMLENAILIFMRIYNFVNNYYLIINLCLNCENCRPRRHRYQHLHQSSCLLPV